MNLINTHRLDVRAVYETWIVNDDPAAVTLDCIPTGYQVCHLPQLTATRSTRGGDVCIIVHHNTLSVRSHPKQQLCQYASFECMLVPVNECGSTRSTDNISAAVIYQPPTSSMSQFYDDLSDMFARIGDDINTDWFVACGDFNRSGTDSTSIQAELTTLFNMCGLEQHVSNATRTNVYSFWSTRSHHQRR